MLDTCANPGCATPLKYLRDGRIFIFDVGSPQAGPDGKRLRHLEHYWLCGTCSQSLILEQDRAGIRVVPRPSPVLREIGSYGAGIGGRPTAA